MSFQDRWEKGLEEGWQRVWNAKVAQPEELAQIEFGRKQRAWAMAKPQLDAYKDVFENNLWDDNATNHAAAGENALLRSLGVEAQPRNVGAMRHMKFASTIADLQERTARGMPAATAVELLRSQIGDPYLQNWWTGEHRKQILNQQPPANMVTGGVPGAKAPTETPPPIAPDSSADTAKTAPPGPATAIAPQPEEFPATWEGGITQMLGGFRPTPAERRTEAVGALNNFRYMSSHPGIDPERFNAGIDTFLPTIADMPELVAQARAMKIIGPNPKATRPISKQDLDTIPPPTDPHYAAAVKAVADETGQPVEDVAARAAVPRRTIEAEQGKSILAKAWGLTSEELQGLENGTYDFHNPEHKWAWELAGTGMAPGKALQEAWNEADKTKKEIKSAKEFHERINLERDRFELSTRIHADTQTQRQFTNVQALRKEHDELAREREALLVKSDALLKQLQPKPGKVTKIWNQNLKDGKGDWVFSTKTEDTPGLQGEAADKVHSTLAKSASRIAEIENRMGSIGSQAAAMAQGGGGRAPGASVGTVTTTAQGDRAYQSPKGLSVPYTQEEESHRAEVGAAFGEENADTAMAVAHLESAGGNFRADNVNAKTRDHSHGWFQINLFGQNPTKAQVEALYDPAENIRRAGEKFQEARRRGGTGWEPWTNTAKALGLPLGRGKGHGQSAPKRSAGPPQRTAPPAQVPQPSGIDLFPTTVGAPQSYLPSRGGKPRQGRKQRKSLDEIFR